MKLLILILLISFQAIGQTDNFFWSHRGALSTMPIVTTDAVTAISGTNATCGGNVTAAGGSAVTARGVVWNTAGSPTISSYTGKTSNGTGTGTFISSITGLSIGTVYHVRAYATNSSGTAYGEEIEFSASPIYDTSGLALANTTCPAVTTPIISSHTIGMQTTTIVRPLVFGKNYKGAAWRYLIVKSFNGDLDGDGNSVFRLKYSGTVISSYPYTTIDISSLVAGDNTLFTFEYYDVSGVLCSSTDQQSATLTYYIIDVNSVTGMDQTISMINTGTYTPVVTTSAVTEISSESAISGVAVTDAGRTSITSKGICWSTSANPTVADNFIELGADATIGNEYAVYFGSLASYTDYHVRAYASNNSTRSDGGTVTYGYGADIPFTTLTEMDYTIVSLTSASAEISCIWYIDGTQLINIGGALNTTINPVVTDPLSVWFAAAPGYVQRTGTIYFRYLTANTHYYFRVAAETATSGIVYGPNIEFTTLP